MDAAVIEEYSVSYVNEENKVYTTPENGGQSGDTVKNYLRFVALEDGTFSFRKQGSGDDIQYSKDNGTIWTPLASGENVSVVTGDKVMWKATITPNYYYGIGKFSSSKKFNVYGNVMSLLYGDDFKEQTSLEGKDYALNSLFNSNSGLIDASNLILPATTLATHSYYEMFSGCTSLTTAPKLPATTLATSCYYGMFSGCTSLTTAPELPSTNMSSICYGSMFEGCTSLTTAPSILPATSLSTNCYSFMFKGCTSLTTAPELPSKSVNVHCYNSMFSGCTSLTTAPELPAKTLSTSCYDYMFAGCTSLKHITMLATNISAKNCLRGWVYNVSSTGTFVKHPDMDSLPTGSSGIPEGWTVEDAVL